MAGRLVCGNGHVQEGVLCPVGHEGHWGHRKGRCDCGEFHVDDCGECGAELLDTCMNDGCETPIHVETLPGGECIPANFCHVCGIEHPWSDQQNRLLRFVLN